MPFGIHKHSNRSKQALNDTVALQGSGTSSSPRSASPVLASGADEARTTQTQVFEHQGGHRPESQIYATQSPVAGDRRAYQDPTADIPARSQSTRFPSAYQQQQAVHLQPTGSADDLILDPRRSQQQAPINQAQAPAAEPKKSKSLFDRMRSSSNRTSENKAPPSQSYNNTSGISRKLSRRQENPPAIQTSQQPTALEQQRLDWQAAQDSRTQLQSPQEANEEDEGEIDPYQIRDSPVNPQSAPHSATQEYNQQPGIRPVQNDLDYDERHYPVPPQHSHHQPSESGSSNQYQYQHHSGHAQPQLNIQSGTFVTSDPYRQQNPETVSQLSYDSPVAEQREEQRPVSEPNGQSPTTYPSLRQEYPSHTISVQGPRPLSQYNPMAPQVGGSQQTRRTANDSKQTMQGGQGQAESRDGPPPNYSRQQFSGNAPPTPGLVSQTSQGPNYRGGPPQREQYGPLGGGEQGRSTPPPAPGERDVNDAYKELLTKYKKVKGLYFDKTAQVEQLQNTLANQRLSQSRTSLDDSEYMTRFQRLDGAITNLAFNIRKHWRSIPSWLSQYCNQDATKVGKQEMTGVGRACITKFLMEEIFNRSFHPGLDVEMSHNLKAIEQNIRRFSPALNNQEESDALTSKIVNWRLATLEGLRDVLASPESEEYKDQFSRVCTTNLSASLINFLQEPVPAGIEDSAHMIVELAVSIASNLPLESRDINIMYPMPGDLLQPYIMKIEAGIPPLENPGGGDTSTDLDGSSTGSTDKDDNIKESDKDGKVRKEKIKQGMLSAMMGGSSSGSGKKGSSQSAAETSSGEAKSKVSTEEGSQTVRFAGFVGVEVRGRQMLGKAPVWTVC